MTLIHFKHPENCHYDDNFTTINNMFNRNFTVAENSNHNGNYKNEPAVNILETNDEFRLELAVPGRNKKDFKIEVEKDILKLTAAGNTKEIDKERIYNTREFTDYAFEKQFILPESVDAEKIGARYENGILYITIPKNKEDKKLEIRNISVN
ncbi:MAG: Hsp20/alpha crystallin family protein [Bacteroidales bacterium]|nr:Hsp20/alpha crystallin family protein [Bacteroidales bacterium]